MTIGEFMGVLKVAINFLVISQYLNVTIYKNIDNGITIKLLIDKRRKLILLLSEVQLNTLSPKECYDLVYIGLTIRLSKEELSRETHYAISTYFTDKVFKLQES